MGTSEIALNAFLPCDLTTSRGVEYGGLNKNDTHRLKYLN